MNSPFRAFSRSPEPNSLQHAIRARSAAYLAPPHVEPLARPDPNDAERRLEQELSQILSRRPAKRPLRPTVSTNSYADIEPNEPPPRTMPFVGAHFQRAPHDVHAGHPADALEDNAIGADDDAGDAYALATSPPLEPSNTNWLLTARRARRNRKLRLAASWVITILVGGFIILVAAAIVFGIPGGKFAFREEAVLAATPEFNTTPSPARTALSDTRWHLD